MSIGNRILAGARTLRWAAAVVPGFVLGLLAAMWWVPGRGPAVECSLTNVEKAVAAPVSGEKAGTSPGLEDRGLDTNEAARLRNENAELKAELARIRVEMEAPRPEEDEARLTAPVLAERNIALGQQVAGLEDRVDLLTATLAFERAEQDIRMAKDIRAEMSEGRSAGEAGLKPAADVRVVDANRDLGMIVLNAGTLEGIRSGMRFYVLREDRKVARVRTTVVRERIAGAVLEEAEAGEYPRAGDRVVLQVASDR